MANDNTPVIFSAENLNMAYGDQVLLNNASLTVHMGERVGLVGRNGCGKSTFLRIVSETESQDSGGVMRKRDLVTGFLSQEFTLDETKNVYENILDGARHILKMVEEYESLPYDSPKHHDLERKINEIDAWNIDYKVKSVMDGVKTPAADREVKDLSGGEKRRVALAKAIVGSPNLLILDEPTNHLDTESIEWLEKFMAGYKGACIFVTHDRYFLDRLSTRVIELSNGIFYSYQGNYTNYLVEKAKREELNEREEHKRSRYLKKELDWIRRSPKARTTKSQSRVDKFYEVESIKAPEKDLDIDLVIPPAGRLGNKVIELDSVKISFGERDLIRNFSFIFEPGSKIGIVGKNGVGKTTLLKLILGQIKPNSGKIETAANIKFNYVDQTRVKLNNENSVYDEIGEGNQFVWLGDEKISIWGYLKRFLFTDERIKTKVGRLSGGERGRLMMAKILKNGGNFIILDEPTNDLDLPTLRLLEEALINFKGCVLIVSHDRYFLNRVCTGILAFDEEDKGEIEYSIGNYAYYLEKKVQKEKLLEPNAIKKNQKSSPNAEKKNKPRKLTWKEERELESMEEMIAEAEERIEEIEKMFMAHDFYEKHAEDAISLNNELEKNKQMLDVFFERWEELEELKKLSGK